MAKRSFKPAKLDRTPSRFLRSINLERDFNDPHALDGYVVTPYIREHLHTLVEGLRPGSTRRAWRITGDYGSGKSIFALALARSLSTSRPAGSLGRELGLAPRTPPLLPILVTGSSASFSRALVEALYDASRSSDLRTKLKPVAADIASLHAQPASDAEIVRVLGRVAERVRSSGIAAGVLVVIDELGRFLEFSAQHPELQDIGLYQLLAETAARSGANPIIVVGLLHEGFAAYASHLSATTQREWEKVAGRFEEMVFAHPVEQTAFLAAEALGFSRSELPSALRRQAQGAMRSAIEQGWFGSTPDASALIEVAPRLFPLHPTVLPVASTLFTRYGQNERSLFSFLISQDVFGVRAFAQVGERGGRFYRLAHLYDYARVAFGRALNRQGYRSHWPMIETTVESYPTDDPLDLSILKTVALINLASSGAWTATADTVELAVGSWSERERDAVRRALDTLHRRRKVLYHRGVRGGYCLWPSTGVDLDRSYHEASQAVPPVERCAPLLMEDLRPESIVARRHYIVTGTLRHYAIRILDGHAFAPDQLQPSADADGQIFIVLCETAHQHDVVQRVLADAAPFPPHWLVGISTPVAQLQGLVTEVRRWEWVVRNVPELAQDAYAREEADRQLATARRMLNDRLAAFVDLGAENGGEALTWIQGGQPIGARSGRALLALLSDACDAAFPLSPRVHNELINRRRPSSAAASARLRLMERMLENSDRRLLGLDHAKRPPEASMYLSLLAAGHLHARTEGGWRIALPAPGQPDPLHLAPTFGRILEALTREDERRVPVSELIRVLVEPPYGVREGLIPLLLTAVLVAHEDAVALYENNAFLPNVTAYDLHRLVKAPETFELQFCRIGGVRRGVFRALMSVLSEAPDPAQPAPDVLTVVRPLCEFAARLPLYVRRTRSLTALTTAVRDALLSAREPLPLIFRDLPAACELPPLRENAASAARTAEYVERLRAALTELREAYPTLLSSLATSTAQAFDAAGPTSSWRPRLCAAGQRLLLSVTDPALRVFCLRLVERNSPDDTWITALAAHVVGKPVPNWDDSDVRHFGAEIARWAGHFRRVEAALEFPDPNGGTARVAVTFADGRDIQRIVNPAYATAAEVADARRHLAPVLDHGGEAALIAMTQLLWERLVAPAPNEPAGT